MRARTAPDSHACTCPRLPGKAGRRGARRGWGPRPGSAATHSSARAPSSPSAASGGRRKESLRTFHSLASLPLLWDIPSDTKTPVILHSLDSVTTISNKTLKMLEPGGEWRSKWMDAWHRTVNEQTQTFLRLSILCFVHKGDWKQESRSPEKTGG